MSRLPEDDDQQYEREFWTAFEKGLDPETAATIVRHGGADIGVRELAKELSDRIAQQLAAAGPAGWRQLTAVFAIAATDTIARVVFVDDAGRSVLLEPRAVLSQVVELRELSARLDGGPWWRFLLELDSSGELRTEYDYGDVPFPDEQLFPPEAYRADLEAYPRDRLPVWLAAYVGHGDRQQRSPGQAAAAVRSDLAAGVAPVPSDREFPVLPVLWARWAAMAAAFVAVGSEWGPRILPSLGWFEGAKRSGSTLYLLPGGRAVLSGGVWDAAELDRTYNDRTEMPGFYAGAPAWVAGPVLNPRTGSGLLSFCYWFDGGRWYRGESPASAQLSDAVPGLWTEDTVVGIIAGLTAAGSELERTSAAAILVSAAESGKVTRGDLVGLFGDADGVDIDAALYQLTMAGVAATEPEVAKPAVPERMPEAEAISRVRQYITGREMDTRGYPLSELRADRFSVGWMVYVPVPAGTLSIGRAIFYVADDGDLIHSSSSIAPSRQTAEIEKRFRERHGLPNQLPEDGRP